VVESNNDEERLARIEQILEKLQRDGAAQKRATEQISAAVVELDSRVARTPPPKRSA